MELFRKDIRSLKTRRILSDFKNLHISSQTKKSLTELGFIKMTLIQRISIPPGLRGLDILGSARTGSGKTLCFVIPIVEILWINKWSEIDSIGAFTLCPTRELAIQIFDFTKHMSSNFAFNVGTLIGGNNCQKKKKFSIVISTPGCLFHHMIVDKNLNCDNLKILAIDEADKILDKSFWKIINFMIKFLPKKKQVLLFSATLNTKIRNVARLNLKTPIFCCIKTGNTFSRYPKNVNLYCNCNRIKHFVILLSYDEKINILFSFLKSHKMQKIIIFLSTKKQVKFLSECFRELNPEFLIFCTHGSMNQNKRINNFISFNQSNRGFLFSTDLMARGLDFKSIDWIVQLDCPQGIETYIHRVGRTGRFLESGKAILFLYRKESKFIGMLNENLIKIYNVKIHRKHIISIERKIETLLIKNTFYILLAQNAFISYAKFIFFQKNKEIFDFNNFNWKKIASSFGLNNSFLHITNFNINNLC